MELSHLPLENGKYETKTIQVDEEFSSSSVLTSTELYSEAFQISVDSSVCAPDVPLKSEWQHAPLFHVDTSDFFEIDALDSGDFVMLPNYQITAVKHHPRDDPACECYFPEQYTPSSFFACLCCKETTAIRRAMRLRCGHFCCDVCSAKVVVCFVCKSRQPYSRINFVKPVVKLGMATTKDELERCFLPKLNELGKANHAKATSMPSPSKQASVVSNQSSSKFNDSLLDRFDHMGLVDQG